MSKYWSDVVKEIKPYVPGEQPKDKVYIKLNTNENPYPPSPYVIKAIERAANESLRLYPDPACDSLRSVIARYNNLKKEQVFVGNGSDEVLAFSFMAFFNPGDTIVFPDITYSFYEVYASLFRLNYRNIPLNEDFELPVSKFFGESDGVVVANPNAPTGKAVSANDIKSIAIGNMDKVVIVDEAYIDFGGESSVKLVNEYPNVLVIQTLSKSRSLAGLRLGFAIGHEDLIEGLLRIKNSINSYTLDRIALAGAEQAFLDEAYFKENVSKIINTRETITEKLRCLRFYVLDSKANFIFISHPNVSAEKLFWLLRENNILVRHFHKPRIDNYLRVSIGTDEEMDYFHKVVKNILKNMT